MTENLPPVVIPKFIVEPQIVAGDRYRRRGTQNVVLITKTTTDPNGVRRVWFDRGYRFFNLSNETWAYELIFRTEYERVD